MKAMVLVFERLRIEPFNIELMANDVMDEFPNLSNEQMIKAIRNGALGKYGRTFRMSTQEVCFWIREFQKEKQNKGLGL